jgi:hypothetical protein
MRINNHKLAAPIKYAMLILWFFLIFNIQDMIYKQIEYDHRPIRQSCRELKKNLMRQTTKVMMLFQDNEMRQPGKKYNG